VAWPVPAATRRTGVDQVWLRAQARATGGAVITASEVAQAVAARRPARPDPAPPGWAILALLALLAETARWAHGGVGKRAAFG
jgi:hypothetical protein